MEVYDDDDDTGGDDVEGDHQIHYSHYNHEELYVVSLLLYDYLAVFHVSHVHCFPSQVKVQHHPLCTCDLLVSSNNIPVYKSPTNHSHEQMSVNFKSSTGTSQSQAAAQTQ